MSMPMFSFGQLAAFAAYLLLALAFFGLAERRSSTDARIAAIGFGYDAVAILLQFLGMVSPAFSGWASPGMSHLNPMYWLLYGLRPFVTLLAAVFAWRCLAKLGRPQAGAQDAPG